ncbi:hypothetical protein HK098_000736 [Nowakowskiella sp. JEL0407]|nr:hypothetical protein HK098_000736 [Nowakowskiella sp. JEL0407]
MDRFCRALVSLTNLQSFEFVHLGDDIIFVQQLSQIIDSLRFSPRFTELVLRRMNLSYPTMTWALNRLLKEGKLETLIVAGCTMKDFITVENLPNIDVFKKKNPKIEPKFLALNKIRSLTLIKSNFLGAIPHKLTSEILQKLCNNELLQKLEIEVGTADHANLLSSVVRTCGNLRTLSVYWSAASNSAEVKDLCDEIGFSRSSNIHDLLLGFPRARFSSLLDEFSSCLFPKINTYYRHQPISEQLENLSLIVYDFSNIISAFAHFAVYHYSRNSSLKRVKILTVRSERQSCVECLEFTRSETLWKVRVVNASEGIVRKTIEYVLENWSLLTNDKKIEIDFITFHPDDEGFVLDTLKRNPWLSYVFYYGEWYLWPAGLDTTAFDKLTYSNVAGLLRS